MLFDFDGGVREVSMPNRGTVGVRCYWAEQPLFISSQISNIYLYVNFFRLMHALVVLIMLIPFNGLAPSYPHFLILSLSQVLDLQDEWIPRLRC